MAKSAPGKHYRKGISIPVLMTMFPDDETAEAWFVEQRWPDGVRCAYCDSASVQEGTTHPYHALSLPQMSQVLLG